MRKLEHNKENFRLLAFIISKASSGSLSTKLLQDAGWSAKSTSSEAWQLSKQSKEDYLFDQFNIIASQGRFDILDYVVEKTINKDGIYFKTKDKEYSFPAQQFREIKSKLKIVEVPQKKNIKLFNDRKFHNSVIYASKNLFKDEHYSQSIFEACKLLNKRVQDISGSPLDGKKLMLDVFSVNNPKIKLNSNSTTSDKDEQEGFMHIYAGVMHGIRNPKGHDLINLKDKNKALEYLSLLSLLFKRLDERV